MRDIHPDLVVSVSADEGDGGDTGAEGDVHVDAGHDVDADVDDDVDADDDAELHASYAGPFVSDNRSSRIHFEFCHRILIVLLHWMIVCRHA